MICLKLFLTFLMIGATSFGGGYGMISVMREQVDANGWLTESELLNVIAVSESTPGPIAVNLATFIGSRQAGFPGALCATLGVILPSFLIILLIAALIRGFLKYKGVQAFLGGVRPCVVALILATALTMALHTLFGITTVKETAAVDFRKLIILVTLVLAAVLAKKLLRKQPSPVLMILISAALGMVIYSIT